MIWHIPSWNGDFRFEECSEGTVRLAVERPTPAELEAIRRWAAIAKRKGWLPKDFELDPLAPYAPIEGIEAPLTDVAAPMAKLLGHGKVGQITALAFEGGKVKVTEVIGEEALPRWMKKEIAGAKTRAAAAVTVARPKLSCPECEGRPEGERKACDVLWAFLDPDQRREWLSSQRITAIGSRTGHAYDLAPRDSPRAGARGRICLDMDDLVLLHNFDLSLPPEEELLQAKLVLEHREEWLRVEGEVDPTWRASPGTVFRPVLPGVYS
jgi:hypothetical protein